MKYAEVILFLTKTDKKPLVLKFNPCLCLKANVILWPFYTESLFISLNVEVTKFAFQI